MKALITGASGFIGRRLAIFLKEAGHDVAALVRETSDTKALEERKIQLVYADITDAAAVDGVFRSEKPEYVFHCAAKVKGSPKEDIFRINIEGTRNICESSRKHRIKRLVYLSTIAVVSDNKEIPLKDDLRYNSHSIYGLSKIEAEKIVIEYRKKDLESAIIRPCMVYGEDEPHAMTSLLELVSKRRFPVIDMKGLHEKLHLAYVGNVVYAMDLVWRAKGAAEETFFIADREVITIGEFLRITADELGAKPPLVLPAWLVRPFLFIPYFKRVFNRIFKDRVYDITRALTVLGYDPPVSTEEGLRRTVRCWMEKSGAREADHKKPRRKKIGWGNVV